MWQVLLAAAIAGSGYLAKHLVNKNDSQPINYSSQSFDLPAELPPSSVDNVEAEISFLDEKRSSIFRFSSASHESNCTRKKPGRGSGIKGSRLNHERKLGSENKFGDGSVDDQRKTGKKFAVCLKKRRTGRNASAKCDSVDVKDKSSFGWGVGVGIMYMMSAGKAEINRLNAAVDETAKIVQELKDEISKRKSSHNLKGEKTANQRQVALKWDQIDFKKSEMEHDYGFPVTDEGGTYASSILTEEPHQEVLEMDQLEAELESELLKLHVSTTKTLSSLQKKDSTEDLSYARPQDLDLESNQCSGIMPSELDQKLCHLLIEQQESQIVNLESELQQTNLKLMDKESELQALKDCVKRLTEFSLSCPSDEEKEGEVDEDQNKMINGKGKSMIGIKRAINFD